MQDPATGEHPTGRDDDLGSGLAVQSLRFVSRSYALGDPEHVDAILPRDVMLVMVAVVDFGGVDRHRAVQIDGTVGYLAPFDEPGDVVHQPLRPPHGE